MDPTMDTTVRSLSDAFLGILLDKYAEFLACGGIPRPPPLVVDATNAALRSMDPVAVFVSSRYVRSADENAYVTTAEVKMAWTTDTKKPATGMDFLSRLDKIFAGRHLSAEERKVNIPGTTTSVNAWRNWEAMDD